MSENSYKQTIYLIKFVEMASKKEDKKPLSPRSIAKDLKTLKPEIDKELDQKQLRQEIKKRLSKLPIDKLDPPMKPVTEDETSISMEEWENTPHTSFGVFVHNADIYFITRISEEKYYIQTLDNAMMILEGIDKVMDVIKDGNIVIITEVIGNKDIKKIKEKLIYNWEIFKKEDQL